MSAARIDLTLSRAAACLEAASAEDNATPRLEAELLLARVLERSRTWLYTWGDTCLDAETLARFEALIERRVQGEPVAWLLGEREFFGLTLRVSPHTLIPRPDTETLVEQALLRMGEGPGRALDLGTGTGAVALALAAHRPGWTLIGVDLIEPAVALARDNARALALENARFLQSDFFTALEGDTPFDLIAGNPPYIDARDPHLARGDLRREPRSALVAGQAGLADLYAIIRDAPRFLRPAGWLLLEHGHRQGEAVRTVFNEAGYQAVETCLDLGARARVTLGRRAP